MPNDINIHILYNNENGINLDDLQEWSGWINCAIAIG